MVTNNDKFYKLLGTAQFFHIRRQHRHRYGFSYCVRNTEDYNTQKTTNCPLFTVTAFNHGGTGYSITINQQLEHLVLFLSLYNFIYWNSTATKLCVPYRKTVCKIMIK